MGPLHGPGRPGHGEPVLDRRRRLPLLPDRPTGPRGPRRQHPGGGQLVE